MKKANELKKLRRENRALRRRIRDLEQHGAPAAPVERTSDAAAFDASNYFSYLLARLRQKSLFARAEKITRYFLFRGICKKRIRAGNVNKRIFLSFI